MTHQHYYHQDGHHHHHYNEHHHHGHNHYQDTFVTGGIGSGYRHYGRVFTHTPSCGTVFLVTFGFLLVSAGIVMICVMEGGGYVAGVVVTFLGLLFFFVGLLAENSSRRKRIATEGSLIIAGSTPASLQCATTTSATNACPLQGTAGFGPPGYQRMVDSPPSYESLHSQYPSAGPQYLSAPDSDYKS